MSLFGVLLGNDGLTNDDPRVNVTVVGPQLNNVDWKAELRRRAMNEVGESKVGKLADKARKSVTGSAKTVQDAGTWADTMTRRHDGTCPRPLGGSRQRSRQSR